MGLKVVLRIPVRVVYDYGVGCDKIDAKATGASAQQKHESGHWNDGKLCTFDSFVTKRRKPVDSEFSTTDLPKRRV